jgi:hypothetical protein
MNPIWLIIGIIAWLFKSRHAPKQDMNRELASKSEVSNPANIELTWDEYNLFAGFYKFFLDFGLKANVFFYGITGAILTILYNPSNSQSGSSQNIGERLPPPVLKILLVTPFFISIILASAFIIGAFLWWMIARQLNKGLREREVKYRVRPYLHYLTGLLLLFGGLFVFVTCCLYQIMRWHGITVM